MSILSVGIEKGREEGRAEGVAAERQEGIRILIETCRKFGRSREETKQELEESYGLKAEDAQGYLEKFWT